MEHKRESPIEIGREEFQDLGNQLIESISNFLETIKEKPVTYGTTSDQLKGELGQASLPAEGTSAAELLPKTTDLLFNHSLFNGHPKFLGYITSSAAPIGALADLLASSLNPNVGAQILSPVATEIEKQTIQWLAEFIGVSKNYGGILVSGGNMANFTAFLAARTAKSSYNIKEEGIGNATERLLVYCSRTTHTWIEKAAILFGHGSKSIRWIDTDDENLMNNKLLENTIQNDLKEGYKPFMIVGTAGDVSTGVVDNLHAIASISKKYDLWFHIDGAYGIPAAVLPELKILFRGVEEADSIALDPHKWLYSPLEVGCTLIKNPQHLTDTYSSHPEYYNFSNSGEDQALNYYEYGLQNSRGFRALKVWLALQHVGRSGYVQMIGEDIRLSKLLYEKAAQHIQLEAITQSLSITTLRYVPSDLPEDQEEREDYLNTLNEELLNALQVGGEVFLSNAIVDKKYCLRGCIVNFRTSEKDIEEIIDIIVKVGVRVHRELQENTGK